jgi:hypothetical protein
MSAPTRDIVVEAGVTFLLRLWWPQDAPLDLSTDWTALFQVRPTTDSPLLWLAASSEDLSGSGGAPPYITLQAGLPPPAGAPNIIIAVPASVTSAVPPGRGIYDVVLTRLSDGFEKRLLKGAALVERVVSRP